MRTPDFSEQDRETPRSGRAYLDDGNDDDDEHVGVAHQRTRAPIREQDEEDVAEEDIMEILDDDDEADAAERQSR
jgi:hypothetical protein